MFGPAFILFVTLFLRGFYTLPCINDKSRVMSIFAACSTMNRCLSGPRASKTVFSQRHVPAGTTFLAFRCSAFKRSLEGRAKLGGDRDHVKAMTLAKRMISTCLHNTDSDMYAA